MNANQKVLLLGATGMLGASLTPHISSCGCDVATHGRVEGKTSYCADLKNIKTCLGQCYCHRWRDLVG